MTDETDFSKFQRQGLDQQVSIAVSPVQVRMEALRAAATILNRALEVSDATTGNTAAAALFMAEKFADWIDCGEWDPTSFPQS